MGTSMSVCLGDSCGPPTEDFVECIIRSQFLIFGSIAIRFTGMLSYYLKKTIPELNLILFN